MNVKLHRREHCRIFLRHEYALCSTPYLSIRFEVGVEHDRLFRNFVSVVWVDWLISDSMGSIGRPSNSQAMFVER